LLVAETSECSISHNDLANSIHTHSYT
jgi:hypothetical protein